VTCLANRFWSTLTYIFAWKYRIFAQVP